MKQQQQQLTAALLYGNLFFVQLLVFGKSLVMVVHHLL
jgi:hypothetical protein